MKNKREPRKNVPKFPTKRMPRGLKGKEAKQYMTSIGNVGITTIYLRPPTLKWQKSKIKNKKFHSLLRKKN